MPSLIGDAFARVSSDRGDHLGIRGLSDGSTRTLGQIALEARAIRDALARLALPSRPCLVSNVGNDPAFIAALVASLDLGASIVLLDGVLAPAEVLGVAERFS